MTLADITQTKGWKNFMAKVYGIGAAIVIVGALFKIMHWPGASLMLILGLGTEAIIFMLSAFEPIHEEIDWTLVYPELAGLEPKDSVSKVSTKVSLFDEKLLASADNAPQLFEKLTKGLGNLAESASSLHNLSDVAKANNGYVETLNTATKSVAVLGDEYSKSADLVKTSTDSMSNAYKHSVDSINYAVDSFTDSFNKANEKVVGATTNVATSYDNLAKSLSIEVDFSAVVKGNESYNDKLGILNKNLTALNAVFELQLEGGLDTMMEDLKGSVEGSKKYREEITKLAKNVESLSTVYGNMLAAMNINK